ncbi:hypothetical protein CYMTET_35312 [Cymbomonas tetramitiformis]|uniref:Uncharacterized protein n=1 Tax=Cymbomonas tetramitiformis TaxID=36881 RepID=A0AAE0F9F7_9CHLO|nr:hypothetical protein CYMTET_35312 [Cymbomonas tetramitiformis]
MLSVPAGYLVGSPPEDSEEEAEDAPGTALVVFEGNTGSGGSGVAALPIRPRAHSNARRVPRPVTVIQDESEDDMEDLEDPGDDLPEEQEPVAAQGELLLGKYSLEWAQRGVFACQRSQHKFGPEDPKIHWERVFKV